jgi:hypothetical protein
MLHSHTVIEDYIKRLKKINLISKQFKPNQEFLFCLPRLNFDLG